MSARRLFFALWPDGRQRETLRDVVAPLVQAVKGRAVDRRNWHVTLAFIGAYPEDGIFDLLKRARRIEVEPFRLDFDRLEYWPRPRVASLRAAAVPPACRSLVAALRGAMSDLGLAPDEREYRPHVTLVRNARPFDTIRLAQAVRTEWSGFELVESVSGPAGVRYVPLKQ